MIFFKKVFFILLLFFLVNCSDDEKNTRVLHDFPSLSQGQLIDLKKISETIEGFFITTNLSDLDSAWEEQGFYLYVCIRFLNDETVNSKLNKSAIPLLIQVSTHKDKPEAESVLLVHPKTMKSGVGGTFYYEEKVHFKFHLADTSMVIKNTEYNIFDVIFNPKGKITQLSFLKKGTSLEELEKAIPEEEDDDEVEDEDSGEEGSDDENDDDTEEKVKKRKDLILEVTAFAKQFSSSCTGWPILNYQHSEEIPLYLQVKYSENLDENNNNNQGTTTTGGGNSKNENKNPEIPKQRLIPLDAPHQPMN